MRKFEKFTFESFDFDRETLKAKFFYSFDDGLEVFEEIIDFNVEHSLSPELIRSGEGDCDVILNNFLLNLHLALGISYYKLFPTAVLEIKSGYLDDDQIDFWEKFYRNGLGEFFVTNNLDPKGLLRFKNFGRSLNIEDMIVRNNYVENSNQFIKGKSLLLWGGGKDSIVSYSLLKEKKELDLFVFGKLDGIKKSTAEVTGESLVLVKRKLSSNLLKLNKEGYYNGHVPITGIIAFVTFVVSYLYGYSQIVLSNEQSASEGNTLWKGIEVNHQYSKSLEFEQDLKKYLENYISKDIKYFSLLRGVYEYRIAKIFSAQKEFFQNFSSCNGNFKIIRQTHRSAPTDENVGVNLCVHHEKLWCCNCEKCCFVFLILSPFLEEKELLEIFGENLFEKQELETTFRELIGLENHKPFECVGTYEECLLSAKKAIQKYLPPVRGKSLKGDGGIKSLPLVLKNISGEVLDKCNNEEEKKLENKLLKISEKNIIPEEFKKLL